MISLKRVRGLLAGLAVAGGLAFAAASGAHAGFFGDLLDWAHDCLHDSAEAGNDCYNDGPGETCHEAIDRAIETCIGSNSDSRDSAAADTGGASESGDSGGGDGGEGGDSGD
jgi:hypothetical protein